MALSAGGTAASRSQKDKQMAANLKRLGIERTIGVCAACYHVIQIESVKTRYRHVCRGGR